MTAGTISCSCTTIPQQIEVTGLEHQVDGRVTNYVRPSTTRRPSLSIVNKLDRRRVLLTTRSATSRGKFFKFRTWNKVPYEVSLSTVCWWFILTLLRKLIYILCNAQETNYKRTTATASDCKTSSIPRTTKYVKLTNT